MKLPSLLLTSLLAVMTFAACDSSKNVDRNGAPDAAAEGSGPKTAGTMDSAITQSSGGQECPPSLLLAQEQHSLPATAGKEAGHSSPAPFPTAKPAYVVFTREKTLDQAELETYWKKVAATLEGYPMKVLSGYGPFEVLEGEDTEGVVIAEFSSMAAARAWYDSPAYREAREHRFKGAVYRGILVEATGP